MPDFHFSSIDGSVLAASAIRILLTVFIAWLVHIVATRSLRKAVEKRIPRVREESQAQLRARAQTINGAVSQVLKVVITIIALLAVLSEMHVEIAPMLAALGVAGLALGFAAQGIVRDYIHGTFILLEDWYRVGEVAILGGDAGLVEELSLRKTVLRNADGTRIIIPNSEISRASNMTRDWSRLNMDIGVAYGTDIDMAFAAINRVGEEMKADEVWGPDLITQPSAIRVNKLADSAIEIRVQADTKPLRQWALSGEFRKRLLLAFSADSIEIPWPHVKVYMGDGETTPGGGRE